MQPCCTTPAVLCWVGTASSRRKEVKLKLIEVWTIQGTILTECILKPVKVAGKVAYMTRSPENARIKKAEAYRNTASAKGYIWGTYLCT